MDEVKKTKRVPGRLKGDPGTLTFLKKRERRNRIKELILEHGSRITAEKIATILEVRKITIIRDMRQIQDETLKALKELDKEDVFLAFADEMDADNKILLEMVMDAKTDIAALGRNQRSNLYGAITEAMRARASNRKEVIKIGQTLGILPIVRPGIDINITYEEKKTITIEVIEVFKPIILRYITNEEDQRSAAKEIDRGGTAYMRGLNPPGAGRKDKKHPRGRPGHS